MKFIRVLKVVLSNSEAMESSLENKLNECCSFRFVVPQKLTLHGV
jgi:hypothetical protein